MFKRFVLTRVPRRLGQVQRKFIFLILLTLMGGSSWGQPALDTSTLLQEVDRLLLPEITFDANGIVQKVALVEAFSNDTVRTTTSTVWTKIVLDERQDQQRWSLVRIDPREGSSGSFFLIRNNLTKQEQQTFLYRRGLIQPLLISARLNAVGNTSIAEVAGLSFAGLYRITDVETVVLAGGQTAFKVKLLALKGSIAFQRVDLFLDQATLKPVHTVLLSQNEVPLKQVNYRVFSTLGEDDSLVTQIVIDDLAFAAVKTTQTILDTRITELPDELFDPEKLSNVERLLEELGV